MTQTAPKTKRVTSTSDNLEFSALKPDSSKSWYGGDNPETSIQQTSEPQRDKPYKLHVKETKAGDSADSEWFPLYICGEAEGSREWCSEHGMIYVIISCYFRGIGQVVFMDNPWTGFIMFICLLYFNYFYALLGAIAGFTNYATAIILLGKNDLSSSSANNLNNGIFVYNGFLIGLMCGTFVNDLTINTWSGCATFLKLIPCCMVFSYICTSIHVGMTNIFPSFPAFTFPFNFAGFLWLPISLQITWIYSTLVPYLAIDNATPDHPNPVRNVYNTNADDVDWTALFFEGIFRGPVQIYLCSNEYLGMVFIIAIAICNWRASALCLWGSVVGVLFAVLVGIDVDRISFGLHSFNSALTMMAVGCVFADLNVNNLMMAFLHSCICVFIELAMMTVMAPSSMPYLTLPFCLSTMFFCIFAFRKKQEALRRNGKRDVAAMRTDDDEEQMKNSGLNFVG